MENSLKLDALKEVVNIGTSQAANALSKLLGQKVLIDIPEIKLTPIENVASELGGEETPSIGVYFSMKGELQGKILILFELESGKKLASKLTKSSISSGITLSGYERSAIMELGSIMANYYVSALAGLLDTKLLISIPYIAQDMLGAVLDCFLIEISKISNRAFLFDTKIKAESGDLKINFLIFPDDKFLDTLYQRLRL